MEELKTARMTIRPLQRSDLRELHRLYGDEEVMTYITGRPRTPRETARRLRKDLRHHRDHGFGLCLMLDHAEDRVLGRVGLEPRVTDLGTEGELAWMLHREYRGVGYATEAAGALIEWGRARGLARIYAETDPENAASIRVMSRLGMQPAGRNGRDLVFVAPVAEGTEDSA
ncbi:MAG: GNAT family N-acetyltransferase [Gemmatimonadota bacterium]